MGNQSKHREPIREILLGAAAGAVLGGLLTFGLAFAVTGSIVLAPIMAMQGAFTGALGIGWAIAMLLFEQMTTTPMTFERSVPNSVQTTRILGSRRAA